MSSTNAPVEYCGRVVGRLAAAVPRHVPDDHRVVRRQRRHGRGEHVGGGREPVRQHDDRPLPRHLGVDVHATIVPLRRGRRSTESILTTTGARWTCVRSTAVVDVSRTTVA